MAGTTWNFYIGQNPIQERDQRELFSLKLGRSWSQSSLWPNLLPLTPRHLQGKLATPLPDPCKNQFCVPHNLVSIIYLSTDSIKFYNFELFLFIILIWHLNPLNIIILVWKIYIHIHKMLANSGRFWAYLLLASFHRIKFSTYQLVQCLNWL